MVEFFLNQYCSLLSNHRNGIPRPICRINLSDSLRRVAAPAVAFVGAAAGAGAVAAAAAAVCVFGH